MAAKKAPAKKPAARKASGGVDLLGWLKIAAIALGGVAVGYGWRSFFPLALPFESRLVADGRSADIPDDSRVKEAEARASAAQKELQTAQARLKQLEDEKRQAEQELGDLAIKDVLRQ